MAPPIAIDVEGVSDTQGIVIPDPLTVNGITSRREKSGKLVAGVAAGANSDLFKSPVSSCDFPRFQLPTIVVCWKAKIKAMGS
jgi:hypothetical protein